MGIAVMLHSGMRDAPERRIAVLPAPLTITSGVHDAFAPTAWLDTLATSAVAAASTRTSLLGGSHNNLFTHPDELADLAGPGRRRRRGLALTAWCALGTTHPGRR